MVYGGNIGAAAGVETVIKSLDKMQNAEHLCLVIAGAGSRLAACQQLISQVRHGRIVIHTPWPKEETAMVLKAANVLVLPTSGNQSLASVPSKLITYMLAARPIIALALPQSETARVIRDAKCGWVVPPDCPDLLAQRIEQAMKTSSQEMVSRGKSGREYALQHFTAKTCLPRVINVLMKSAVKL
jgi:glycosyltransferase involved in cell wall biosynthesis